MKRFYTCAVVDDEPEIREGMSNLVPWEDLGFRWVGAWDNGKEALEMLEKEPVDVLITDINMPFMDGLALSEQVLTRYPGTKILIISGYDEFEYARRALQLQVHDYIVKPITLKEFKQTLEKLRDFLDAERSQKEEYSKLRQQLAESLPLLKERYLVQLFTAVPDLQELQERFHYFSISLPLQGMVYLLLMIDTCSVLQGETLDLTILSLRNEITLRGGESLLHDEGYLVGIFWEETVNTLYGKAFSIAEICLQRFQEHALGPIVVCLSEVIRTIHQFPDQYRITRRILQSHVLRGEGGIVLVRNEISQENTQTLEPFRQTLDLLERGLTLIQPVLISKAIDELVSKVVLYELSPHGFHLLLERLAALVVVVLEELNIPLSELFPPGAGPFEDLRSIRTLDTLRNWLSAMAESIQALITRRQEKLAIQKVRETLGYIERFYMQEDLSIRRLCEELYISPSYLSALLKTHTGKTFVELLTETRIQKACELLRSSDKKTAEIARLVGYQDPHYFGLIFKKLIGKTPGEYRKNYE
jgi:two-component system response regulator YesN